MSACVRGQEVAGEEVSHLQSRGRARQLASLSPLVTQQQVSQHSLAVGRLGHS